MTDQVKAYCPVNPNTGANQFSGGTNLSTATCIDRNPPTCPSNAAPNATGGCTCSTGYRADQFGATCYPYTCEKKTFTAVEAGASFGSFCGGGGYGFWESGCAYGDYLVATTTATDGTIKKYYQVRSTGEYCDTPAPTQPAAPEPTLTQDQKCALGNGPPMCAATVNGASVCVTCSSSSSTGTETTTAPSGGASAPSGITEGTKTTSTSCVGATCTTTTTYKDPAGNVTGTTTSTGTSVTGTTGSGAADGQPSTLCDVYPNSPACKVSSYSSSCAAGTATVACDGDAVQCAIAREQAKRNCEFFEKPGDETTAATQAKADGIAGASDHPNRSPDTHSLSTFDQTNLIGGSCPADRVLGTGSVQVTLPFSQLCGPASTLGMILVGITALSCIAIVFKGS